MMKKQGNTKKVRKQINTIIVLWAVSALFLLSSVGCFQSSFGTGIVCLLFVAFFAYLGYVKLKKMRSSSSSASAPKTSVFQNLKTEFNIRQKEAEFSDSVSSIPVYPPCVSSTPAKRKAVSKMPEIHYTNIIKTTRVDKLFPFVVIDTETTGLSPNINEIIEVSAIRFEDGFEPVSCFTTLLKPSHPIPAAMTAMTHITNDMVSDKPCFGDIAESLSEYISGCNIVGHNLPFDLRFLYSGGAVIPENVRFYDTLQLAKHTLVSANSRTWDVESSCYIPVVEYDVQNYKLETLCNYYGLYRSDAHRSLSDAFATGKLFENLIATKMS